MIVVFDSIEHRFSAENIPNSLQLYQKSHSTQLGHHLPVDIMNQRFDYCKVALMFRG